MHAYLRYLYIYTYVCKYIYIYTYILVYMHMHTYMHAQLAKHCIIDGNTHIHMKVPIQFRWIHTQRCIYIYIYIHIDICMFISVNFVTQWKNIHTNANT